MSVASASKNKAEIEIKLSFYTILTFMLLVIEQGGEEEHDESEDEDTDDYESDQGKFIYHYNTIHRLIFVYFRPFQCVL